MTMIAADRTGTLSSQWTSRWRSCCFISNNPLWYSPRSAGSLPAADWHIGRSHRL